MFENAISDNKSVDGKLCFEAALLQNSVDSEDIEAVLGYLEACVSSFIKSGENYAQNYRTFSLLWQILRLKNYNFQLIIACV